MADKTWITLSKNGVVDKVFEQNGRPESLQMTNLDANTQYVAQAGLESDGLQSLALQTATFTTLQAGAMSLSLSNFSRYGNVYIAIYSYTSTYAPSSATLSRGQYTYQGVIYSSSHIVRFEINDLNFLGGTTQTIQATMIDIYGESVTSGDTTFTVDWDVQPLTITNTSGETMALTFASMDSTGGVPDLKQYVNGGWSDVGLSIGTPATLTVPVGGKVYLEGYNTSGFNQGARFNITADKEHTVSGNIMSIVNKDQYSTMTSIPAYSFRYLFKGDTHLTSAANMTFGDVVNHRRGVEMDYALENMFDGCTSMLYPPDMSKFEYVGLFGMHYCFANCTSLRDPADLGHVTDANRWAFLYCYEKCTTLQSGSYLSNLGRAEEDYMKGMYLNCSNLYEAFYSKNATTSGVSGWLDGCAAVGVIYVPTEAVRDAIVGTSVVPSGWTVSI